MPRGGQGTRDHGIRSPIHHRPIIRAVEDWALPLFVAGALYLAGAFCWLIVDPNKPVIEPREASG
jgi:hypothetical protein